MSKRKYYIRLVIGSILFGLIAFGNELYKAGTWHISGLLWVAYGIIIFGVPFHILFSVMMKKIEQKKSKIIIKEGD